MSVASSPILKWLRRPQFSLRTFLILVTFVGVPLAVVGSIKFKAYSYRRAIAELQTTGIEVRRIRTDNASSSWQGFVQDWIDNDAYAGDSVEVAMHGTDLTANDVRRLGTFAEIRSIELASPQLTDATLLELPKLKHPSSLVIREGNFTQTGLVAIPRIGKLKSLDLTGLVLDDECMKAIAPALEVDELALNVHACSSGAVQEAIANKNFKRLVLENAAPPNSVARMQTVASVHAFPCDFQIPSCESLFLKDFSVTDEVLRGLSERKNLKSLTLWNGSFDAALGLKLFAMPGSPQQNRPMLRMGEVVETRSEVGPEEIRLLQQQPPISNLTIRKLRSPSESIDILLKNKRLRVLYVPEDVPITDLVKLAKSIDLMSTGFAPPRRESAPRDPNDSPIPEVVYRHHSLHDVLEKNGVDVRALIREKAEAEKRRPFK